MLVFLMDIVDMFLMAYLMGILCEEINKKKVAAALTVLALCGLGVLDFIWVISRRLLCQFLLLGLLIFVLALIFLRRRSYITEIFGKTSHIFSCYMLISIAINIIILLLVYICLKGEYVEKVIPVFSVGIILFSILQMILSIIVQMVIYSRRELKILNEMNRKYIKQQKEHYEDMNKKIMKLGSFHHDFNEYIYTMNDMAARGEIKELREYLADLSKKKETVYYLNTGNHVANAVVNRYGGMAAEQGIIFRYMGRWSGRLYGITDVEICSVLSNILKNAFEAVLRVPAERERKIVVEMGRDDIHEYIFIENTAVGYEEADGKLVTYKKDKEHHGIGMENVRKIMEKCEGTLEWKYENGIFYTWIYFWAEEMTS